MHLKFFAIAAALGLAGLGVSGCVETGGGSSQWSTVYVQQDYGYGYGPYPDYRYRHDRRWRDDHGRNGRHPPPGNRPGGNPGPGAPGHAGGNHGQRPQPPQHNSGPARPSPNQASHPTVSPRQFRPRQSPSSLPTCRAGMAPGTCYRQPPGH